MKSNKIIIIFTVLLLNQTAFALKPMIVISDKGGEPIEKYIAKVSKEDEKLQPIQDISKIPVPKPIKNFDINTRFPIVTKEMKVGKVKRRKLSKQPAVALGADFAIVGYDKHSWMWLKQKKELLEKNGTTILVVNIETAEQLDALRKLLPKNMIDAVPGTDIAKQLKISRYPVLISSEGISQ